MMTVCYPTQQKSNIIYDVMMRHLLHYIFIFMGHLCVQMYSVRCTTASAVFNDVTCKNCFHVVSKMNSKNYHMLCFNKLLFRVGSSLTISKLYSLPQKYNVFHIYE